MSLNCVICKTQLHSLKEQGKEWDSVAVCVDCLRHAPITQERVREWLEEWVRGEIRESDASPDDTNLCYDYARLRLAAFLAEKLNGGR